MSFSSNALPFEPETAYAPFAAYSLLEHEGDFAAAANALAQQGYGQQRHARGDESQTASPYTLPDIPLRIDMTAVVNAGIQAIQHLPNGPHLYQRARQLVILGRGGQAPKWLQRPPEAPVIVPADPAYLKELVGAVGPVAEI